MNKVTRLPVSRLARMAAWGVLPMLLAPSPAPAQGASAASTYYFTTLAGTASAGTADGAGSAARFSYPQGLSIDAAGNLYVADTGSFTIRKITPAGVVTTLAGKPGDAQAVDGPAADARFRSANHVAIAPSGVLYVGDNIAIRRIGTDGKVTTLAGFPGDGYPAPGSVDGTGTAARFNGISGLAVDLAGNIYASDSGACTLRRITPDGVVTTLAGQGKPGAADGMGSAAGFFGPGGLAADASGVLYVPDGGNHTIRRVTPAGVVTTLAGRAGTAGAVDGVGSAASFHNPRAVGVDLLGNVYVSDSFNQCIRAISPSGVVTTLAGQPPSDPTNGSQQGTSGSRDGTGRSASFNMPSGLATDGAGNVYVADFGNNTIRKITPAGVVTTLAGLPPDQSAGSADGIGAAARFNGPRGIVVTADGICYVADAGNHVIRRIARDGTVTTLAGAAGQRGYLDGTGSAARFNAPSDLALDREGNLYVIDASATIRKVTPAGVVTTLAGSGQPGFPADGQGRSAVFWGLTAIAVAPDGNIWVAEPRGYPTDTNTYWWARLRKVTPEGVVTTEPLLQAQVNPHTAWNSLAFDAAGALYACDAEYHQVVKATAAGVMVYKLTSPSFSPWHMAVDASGGVFLTESSDTAASRVARLKPDGQVEILGGRSYVFTHHDGLGTDALFSEPQNIAVDAQGSLYVTCGDNTIRKGLLASAPTILNQPRSQIATQGANVTFSVTATGYPEPTYQWYFNGNAITGATTSSYSFNGARNADAGEYTVTATNALGSVTSDKAVLTIAAGTGGGSGGGGSPGPGGGGGGGAPSLWFIAALGVGAGLRLARPSCVPALRGET